MTQSMIALGFDFEGVRRQAQCRIDMMEDALWEVQLKHYPDSVRVSRADALKWLDWSDSGVLQRAASYWDEHDGILYPDDLERRRERAHYLVQYIERKRLQIARALAFCIQDRVGIFYTCCDGRYKGFRFGLDGSEYLSNFSD